MSDRIDMSTAADVRWTAPSPVLLGWFGSTTLHFMCQLLLLLLHHHFLHTYAHPRVDSFVLLLLEVVLCARRFIMAGILRAQQTTTRVGLPPALPAVAVLTALLVYVYIWIRASERPMTDALLLVPPVIAIAHDPALDAVGWKSASFDDQVRALLLGCIETAFYVGALPSLFARNEAILHERAESYRIAALTFANCAVLELLELFGSVDRERVLCMLKDGSLTTARESSGAALAASPTGGGNGKAGSTVAKRGSAGKARNVAAEVALEAEPSQPEPVVDDHQLLAIYIERPDEMHMGIVYWQSFVVFVQLFSFMYTHHWRAHAVSLVANYGLLYLCVIFRQRAARRAAGGT